MNLTTLDLVYIVLAMGLVPFFILICMNLWKLYRLLNHADTVLNTADEAIRGVKNHALNFVQGIERVPSRMLNSVMNSVRKFF